MILEPKERQPTPREPTRLPAVGDGRAKRARARGIGTVCLAVAGAWGAPAVGAEGVFIAAPEVSAPAATAEQRTPPAALPHMRRRFVNLQVERLVAANPDVRQAPDKARLAQHSDPELRLNLFADASFHAVVERTFPVHQGHALHGRLIGVPAGRFTLAVRGATVTGTVLTPVAAFVVRPVGDGRHVVAEVDRAFFPSESQPGQDRRVPPPIDAPPTLFIERDRAERDARNKAREHFPTLGNRMYKSAPAPLSRAHRGSGVGVIGGDWQAVGPGPILYGQVENVTPDDEVVGAVHTVLAHPTKPGTLYIGATNGGIWRTDNATALRPTWRPLTDHASSLSIGAMAFDSADPNTIVAGIGRYSSFGSAGGDRTGFLLSRDAGESWRQISNYQTQGRNISGVVVRGKRLVASAGPFSGGVLRSTDDGHTWHFAEDLPRLGAMDLVEDPSNPERLYVSIWRLGIFRSDDGGARWQNVSSHDATLTDAFTRTVIRDGRTGSNNNAELAVGVDGRLFVAVLVGGQAQYIGFTDDQGGSWTAMDLPLTLEYEGRVDGLNPRFKPGGQGAIHFSILVDPDDTDIVYVGGDRQNLHFGRNASGELVVYNALGAADYTGRLFRGDASVAATGEVPSPQWQHLTHRDDVATIPGGGTRSSSAPHADSREMVFDARGDLVEVNDGGVYRRTSPKDNRGDWFSLNGNLQVSEMHDVAYDPLSKVLIGGNQDTGTPEQQVPGGTTWTTVTSADGGDVAVDSSEAPARSWRYSSYQFFQAFRRFAYNANNNRIGFEFPRMEVEGVSVHELDPNFQFVQRFSLNAVDPTRAVVGAASVYETLDRFATLTEVQSLSRDARARVTATAYGCVDNPRLLYFGHGSAYSAVGSISVRRDMGDDGAFGPDDVEITNYAGASVVDIAIDQDDCATVYAIANTRVFVSNDTGETWRDITGNLTDVPVDYLDLRNIQVVPPDGLFGIEGAIVVGSRAGVHVMFPRAEGTWFAMNDGLPHAPVWDLDYAPEDNMLIAATLGRGAWRWSSGPTAAKQLATQVLEVADGDLTVDLTSLFNNPGGGSLVYTVESANPAVATAVADGGFAVVTPNAAGEVIIRVTATDAAGRSGVSIFVVAVGAVASIPPAAATREGGAIYLPLRLSRPLRSTTVLRYSLSSDGNAYTADASPDDYEATGYLVLFPGATNSTIYVRIVDDALIESTREVFTLTLVSPVPNADFGIGLRKTTTVTINEGVCDRTYAVRDAVRGSRDCADVADVSDIETLQLSGRGLRFLRSRDFSGMSALQKIDLSDNSLRALPAGVFLGLINLRTLVLSNNELSSLPIDAFFYTPGLMRLELSNNRFTSLAASTFANIPYLAHLHLDNNLLTELPGKLFAAQFRLFWLNLRGNQLESLPDGLFAGLDHVGALRLGDNPGTPFAFNLDLARTNGEPTAPGPAEVALRVRQGAPFDMDALVTVAGGVLGAGSVTINTGEVTGPPVLVTRQGKNRTTVSLAKTPPVPAGLCGLAVCYEGLEVALGEPLALFDEAATR